MNYSEEGLRYQIAKEATSWIGTKFHHQGRIKKSSFEVGGCDCIGLILAIAKKFGFVSRQDGKPLSEHDEFNYSKFPQKNKLFKKIEQHLAVVNRPYIKTGDIGLFKISTLPQHVGVFINEATTSLVHAYQVVGKVCMHNYSNLWRSRLIKSFSFNELR
ncbi:MAG: hypothetical protein RLN62_05425 [Rickettsiales bacterium]